MYKCPVCGTKLDLALLTMTPRQRELLDAVEQIERNTGKPGRTNVIAAQVGLAPSTIKPDLKIMREQGVLCCPNGPKSGWGVRKHHIKLVRVA
jgi:predicted transcriptional regulator